MLEFFIKNTWFPSHSAVSITVHWSLCFHLGSLDRNCITELQAHIPGGMKRTKERRNKPKQNKEQERGIKG